MTKPTSIEAFSLIIITTGEIKFKQFWKLKLNINTHGEDKATNRQHPNQQDYHLRENQTQINSYNSITKETPKKNQRCRQSTQLRKSSRRDGHIFGKFLNSSYTVTHPYPGTECKKKMNEVDLVNRLNHINPFPVRNQPRQKRFPRKEEWTLLTAATGHFVTWYLLFWMIKQISSGPADSSSRGFIVEVQKWPSVCLVW